LRTTYDPDFPVPASRRTANPGSRRVLRHPPRVTRHGSWCQARRGQFRTYRMLTSLSLLLRSVWTPVSNDAFINTPKGTRAFTITTASTTVIKQTITLCGGTTSLEASAYFREGMFDSPRKQCCVMLTYFREQSMHGQDLHQLRYRNRARRASLQYQHRPRRQLLGTSLDRSQRSRRFNAGYNFHHAFLHRRWPCRRRLGFPYLGLKASAAPNARLGQRPGAGRAQRSIWYVALVRGVAWEQVLDSRHLGVWSPGTA